MGVNTGSSLVNSGSKFSVARFVFCKEKNDENKQTKKHVHGILCRTIRSRNQSKEFKVETKKKRIN